MVLRVCLRRGSSPRNKKQRMNWIMLAVGGYFLGALALVTDKFLISSDRLPRPAGYAFITSVFGLFVSVFAPFETAPVSWYVRGISIVSGVLFVYGLLFLYTALKRQQVSLVAPLVGMSGALVTLVPALISSLFSGSDLHNLFLGLMAFGLFLVGGVLVAFDLPFDRKADIPWKPIVLAGSAIGISYLVLKFGYATADSPFIGSVVWSRLGFFFGGLSFFLFPELRREIIETIRDFRKPTAAKKNAVTGVVFVANKVLGGLAVLLVNGAIFLGPVGLVQAMDALRFAFVFLVARIMTGWYPEIFHERLSLSDWLQKLSALVLLGLGLWLASQVMTDALPLLS